MSANEIKLFWWRAANQAVNVGDEINGHVVEAVSGRRVVRSSLVDADMLAIGSVLHFPQREKVLADRANPYLVWGSGTLNAVPIEAHEKFVLSALRGPLTNSLFGHRPNLPFGDPGLLASRIWEPKGPKTAKWGLIPHHSQLERPWVKELLEKSENCRLIDVTNSNIAETMEQISSCEFIASTSLHGLIFADSYKIPSVWLWDGALHSGGSWKFFDYFAGAERSLSDNVAPSRIRRLDDVDMTTKSFSHFSKIDMICNRLVMALPV